LPGGRRVFVLGPGQAFGARRDELVQPLPRSAFPPDMELDEGTVVEFSGPNGGKHAGIVRAIDAHDVRVDFNHPLAGSAVRFEVEVLAVT
jgi:FKBP-type peptidyl-prolyl cis-trans isomerase SlpA